jgi:hypothetical protein
MGCASCSLAAQDMPSCATLNLSWHPKHYAMIHDIERNLSTVAGRYAILQAHICLISPNSFRKPTRSRVLNQLNLPAAQEVTRDAPIG